MATEQSPISRQPTKLDYSSPTQFKFSINQLPKVEFFTTAANLPGINLGDATLTILSNKNNPLVEVRFQDVYPVSLGALQYDQSPTDVNYLTVNAEFDYKIYEIITL